MVRFLPVGKKVVGGGVLSDTNSTLIHVHESYPSDDVTWKVTMNAEAGAPGSYFVVYAVCVTA